MAGIMDLLRQVTANTNGPQDILQAPAGMPGASMLNRPAGPDIMGLIQMLTQGGMGGMALPALNQGSMLSELGMGGGMPPMPPEIAAMLQPAPRTRSVGNGPNEPEGPGGARQEQRLKNAENPKRAKSSDAGYDKQPKKKKSAKSKMADDMIAADRAGSAVSNFVRK